MILLSTALQHSCDRVDSPGFAVFGSSLLLPAQGIVLPKNFTRYVLT